MKSYQGYRVVKEEGELDDIIEISHKASFRKRLGLYLGFIVFLLAYTALLLRLSPYLLQHKVHDVDVTSKFAGLDPSSSTSFLWTDSSIYTDGNHTLAMQAWRDIKTDNGVVALSDSFAASKDLASGWRFPWDASKGLYVLVAYHNLHCTRYIYLSMMEFKHGEPQTYRWGHILHCLDTLRRDTLCRADDTPLPVTGKGFAQQRQCRDWSQLETWAHANNACYRRIYESSRPNEHLLERFKFCPPGSPYRKEAEKEFGPIYDDGSYD